MSECRSNSGTVLNPPESFPAVRTVPLTRNGPKRVMYPMGIACVQLVHVRNYKSSSSLRESHD
jgi:hypothetical protein